MIPRSPPPLLGSPNMTMTRDALARLPHRCVVCMPTEMEGTVRGVSE
jgi:hypothetical protein